MSLVLKKELKFTGQIGSPKDTSKPSLSSLAHQIENVKKKNYSDQEICEASIKAISTGLNLRSYLEGKTDLTLPQLRKILRAHFSERDATESYTELSNAIQHSFESVQDFVVRLINMRQVIFASQESESQLTESQESKSQDEVTSAGRTVTKEKSMSRQCIVCCLNESSSNKLFGCSSCHSGIFCSKEMSKGQLGPP